MEKIEFKIGDTVKFHNAGKYVTGKIKRLDGRGIAMVEVERVNAKTGARLGPKTFRPYLSRCELVKVAKKDSK